MSVQRLQTDVLIIGGGLAAAEAAIEASKHGVRVLLVDKGRFGSSGASATSGGNPQAYVPPELGGHPEDSPEALLRDILAGGQFLSVQKLATLLAEEIADRVLEADGFGVPYLKGEDGRMLSFKTMGTSHPRVGPVKGWGMGMMLAFRKEALHRNVATLEGAQVLRLLLHGGQVCGALALDLRTAETYLCSARSVILAAGGAADLYPNSSSCYPTTGDSYFLAYDAGAELINMEFQEFTLIPAPRGVALPTGGIKPALSAGARFYNRGGERFMHRYDPRRMEGTSRANLVGAVYSEMAAGRGPCYLDASAVPEPCSELDRFRFMAIRKLTSLGVDHRTERVPWIPAIHGFLGGARINERCESGVAGLYAAGEAAGHGGLFGADRGGSAIAACMVLGRRAGRYASLRALRSPARELSAGVESAALSWLADLACSEGISPAQARRDIQQVAWSNLFISRNQAGLERAIGFFAELGRRPIATASGLPAALEARNLALTGELVGRAALARRESRGQHNREDFPQRDDSRWLAHVVLVKDGRAGGVQQRREPLAVDRERLLPPQEKG